MRWMITYIFTGWVRNTAESSRIFILRSLLGKKGDEDWCQRLTFYCVWSLFLHSSITMVPSRRPSHRSGSVPVTALYQSILNSEPTIHWSRQGKAWQPCSKFYEQKNNKAELFSLLDGMYVQSLKWFSWKLCALQSHCAISSCVSLDDHPSSAEHAFQQLLWMSYLI